MTPTDLLSEAKRLLPVDPVAAGRLAERVHHAAPSNEAALLIAVAARRSGAASAAATVLAPLAGRLPHAWGVHFEHGMALASIGDAPGAIAALGRAVAANPRALLARHALRDLRHLAGATEQDPHLAAIMADEGLRRAATALLDGDVTAAALLRHRFAIDPGDVAAACLIADIGAAGGRHDAVADFLEDPCRDTPSYLPVAWRRAEALHRAGRDDAALDAIVPFAAAAPDATAMLSLRAAILMALARETEALALLRRATTLASGDARVWQGYGHALRAVGRREDALAAYREAIRRAPTFGEAYWSIADLKTAALGDSEVTAMERLLERGGIDEPSRSHLHFALGRANEDRGLDAAAFAHYQRGNALRRKTVPYDADTHDAFVARTIATFDARVFADRAEAGSAAADPIFVLGMPRSGSSLIEQILASHGAVEGASELPDVMGIARRIAATIPYPEGLATLPIDRFAALGADYLDRTRTRRRTDRPHFVDKFPGNVLHIPLIHLMLPNARIIDVRRDARDCCVSLFTQSFAAGQGYSYDLTDLGRYDAAYRRLMRHIDTVLPGRVLRVDYEAMVDDVEGQTRRLLDHCGLEFDSACLRFFETSRAVRTASSEQVRQPIYRGSIGRWRRFEPWLGPLFAALAENEDDGPGAGR